jgi:hypothetical protein
MADTKISALTAATTPLAGTEVLPIVQSGVTKKVSVASLTAGRSVALGPRSEVDTPFSFAGDNYAFALTSAGNGTAFLSNLFGSGELEYGGFYYGAGQYKANVAQYSAINIGPGTVTVYGNTGLTPGSPFVRTLLGTFGSTGLAMPNGKGIDFSATPGTGTSELLADYEEGTWTPTITRAGGGLVYTPSGSDVGFYTKVGRQVTVTCSFGGTWTGGSGDFEITGLPFTVGGALYTRIATSIINNSAANTLGTCWPVTGATKLTSFNTFVSGNICSAGAVYFV